MNDIEANHDRAVEKVKLRKLRKHYREICAAEDLACQDCKHSPKKPWRVAVCKFLKWIIVPGGTCDEAEMEKKP